MIELNFADNIEDFRSHVPVTEEWAYFETASTGLVPDFVYEGIRRYMDERYRKGGDSVWRYEDGDTWTLPMMQKSKEALAEMIHCLPSEIAFGQSATQLFTMVTEGIDYAPEDNVVTVQKGWIGNRYAWQKREQEGLEVRYAVPKQGMITVEQIASLCDKNTRAVSVNLIENTTGYRIDIEQLGIFCEDNGILLFADGVQALGAVDVDVEKSKIDFLVGNDYKWMMNFCGTGYAYISDRVQKLIHHWGAGWMSDADRFNTKKGCLTLREDAGRFEIGQQRIDGIYALGLTAMQNNRIGMKQIETYICGLADYFRQRTIETENLRLAYDFPGANCCQIVVVKVSPGSAVTDADFAEAKVSAHLSSPDENGEREIRISLHYYNNREDIDRFFEVINKKKRGAHHE